jgi:hypothetical protein
VHGSKFFARTKGGLVENHVIIVFEDILEYVRWFPERLERKQLGGRPTASRCEGELTTIGANVDHGSTVERLQDGPVFYPGRYPTG